MHRFFLGIILFSAVIINAFSAHCPAASDFVRVSGDLWGHFWDLSATASIDWVIQDKHSVDAPTIAFPNDSSLMVRIDPVSREVKCLYIFPTSTGFVVNSNNNRKVDLDKINLSIFIPKHQSNDVHSQTNWKEDYSIGSLSCERATAANPDICHWEWLQNHLADTLLIHFMRSSIAMKEVLYYHSSLDL